MPAVPQSLIDLLNRVEPGERILAFTVPLRIIRLITLDDAFTRFRVQQLMMTKRGSQPDGKWKTLSIHNGERPGESYLPACRAAIQAQRELSSKIQKTLAK